MSDIKWQQNGEQKWLRYICRVRLHTVLSIKFTWTVAVIMITHKISSISTLRRKQKYNIFLKGHSGDKLISIWPVCLGIILQGDDLEVPC
jgi:hypothetical protein